MRNSVRLGRILGIEIGLDYSWFIIFALVTWSLAAHYFPMNYRWPPSTYWAVGVITSLLFFVSVLAHELGHSVVAIRRGIPVKAITFFIFGGMAQISKEPERPHDEFLIAIAGPAVSVALGLLFQALYLGAPSPAQPTAALAFIGWFLENAASGSYQQIALRQQLMGVRAREIMMTDCPHVPRSLTLHQLVYEYILKGPRRCFPVVEDGRVLGIITLHHVKEIPQERWAMTTVGQAMTPLEQTKKVRPDQDLFEVLEFMTAEDVNQVPVVDDGRLLGMVSRDRVLAFLATRAELGV